MPKKTIPRINEKYFVKPVRVKKLNIQFIIVIYSAWYGDGSKGIISSRTKNFFEEMKIFYKIHGRKKNQESLNITNHHIYSQLNILIGFKSLTPHKDSSKGNEFPLRILDCGTMLSMEQPNGQLKIE